MAAAAAAGGVGNEDETQQQHGRAGRAKHGSAAAGGPRCLFVCCSSCARGRAGAEAGKCADYCYYYYSTTIITTAAAATGRPVWQRTGAVSHAKPRHAFELAQRSPPTPTPFGRCFEIWANKLRGSQLRRARRDETRIDCYSRPSCPGRSPLIPSSGRPHAVHAAVYYHSEHSPHAGPAVDLVGERTRACEKRCGLFLGGAAGRIR